MAVLYPALCLGAWISASLVVAGKEPLSGETMLRQFLRDEVDSIAASSLEGIASREEWEERRGELRRQLREMLGLVPEPPRGDLQAVVTGIVERRDLGIVVEKLHFQSVPGLYVTANLYRPLEVDGKLPAILYLCGHGRVKIGGVSYGNKAHYQHHPAWFARNGYVSLIIDTLQLGEIEGHHHGTYRLDMWWWVARGYTPAGVEAWNSIRALDYLASRPEVDPHRLGVTGRSGGGIGTWWLAALDDRPLALVPVAGITDMENHVVSGCIEGHCDCNYPVNLYRWDFPALAALAAPRPLLFSNTDKDRIFPLDGVVRVHGKLRGIYDLLGARERLGLLITEGPHGDTQELRLPAFRWMERWLKQEKDKRIKMAAEKLFEPGALKVFQELPADERNTKIHQSFVAAAGTPAVPGDVAAFEALRAKLLARLLEKSFRNAPDPKAAALEVESSVTAEREGLLLRGYRFRSEGAFRLPLWVVRGKQAERPALVVLTVVDEKGWGNWLSEVAAFFPGELGVDARLGDPVRAGRLQKLLTSENWAFAVLAPRGIGPTRWSDEPRKLNHIRRRFLVIGRTLTETRVHDTRRAVRVLEGIEELSKAPLWLQGERQMAGVALYAGLFEPRVSRFDLWSLPASHRQGVTLMNVLKVLDIPQTLALLLPRRVILYNVKKEDFAWTKRAATVFGEEKFLEFRTVKE